MHLLILSVAAYSMFFPFSNFLENVSCALRTIESDLRTYTDVDIMGTGYKPEKIKSLPVPLQFQILNPQNQLTFIEW